MSTTVCFTDIVESGTGTVTEGDDFNVKFISFENGHLLYRGKVAQITIGACIGTGTFGVVNEAEITTSDGKHRCAVKMSKPSRNDDDSTPVLEELVVLDRFPKALTCDGLVNITRTPEGFIIMPLADGDLTKLIPQSVDRSIAIAHAIGKQLQCLHSHGIRYFDVTPNNCVYFVKTPSSISVSLSDLGSMIPAEMHDGIDYYAAAINPPGFELESLVPGNLPDVEKYYTFLLLSLLRRLITKKRISLLTDGDQYYSFKAAFGYYPPVDQAWPVHPFTRDYIKSLQSDMAELKEVMQAHQPSLPVDAVIRVLHTAEKTLQRLSKTDIERNKMLDLGLPPIDEFLSMLS